MSLALGQASVERLQLNRLTLRFDDPALELAYRRQEFDRSRTFLVIGVLILLAIELGFGGVERMLFPALWPQLWPWRYFVAVPLTALGVPLLLIDRLALRLTRDHGPEIMAPLVGGVLSAHGVAGVILMNRLDGVLLMYFGIAFQATMFVLCLVMQMQFRWTLVLSSVVLTMASSAVALGVSTSSSDLWPTFWAVDSLAVLSLVVALAAQYTIERARRQTFAASTRATADHARADRLLRNVLPSSIVDRLDGEVATFAERFDDVSVVFVDLVGFTNWSARRSPAEVVARLDQLFRAFDEVCSAHGAEKIKTIGDAYMAAVGVPQPRADHLVRAARLALALEQAARIHGVGLPVRVGLHAGPLVAGVLGRHRFVYDLWGDTVNTAARMESHGAPGRVQLTADVAARLGAGWRFEPRGDVEIKGKGTMQTVWLLGEHDADPAAVAPPSPTDAPPGA